MAPAELRRFTEKLGASALVDESSRAYGEAGLRYLRMDERELVDRLLERPGLLRLPLVRMGGQVSCGMDETAWRSWLTETGPKGPRRSTNRALDRRACGKGRGDHPDCAG